MMQEYLDGLTAEKAKKDKKDGIIILFGLVIIFIILVFGLKGCAKSLHEQKVEDAGETIQICEDLMEIGGSNEGKVCDDARKICNHYSEKEWREEKKQLIEFEDITEHDRLYDELKREIAKERDY
ncbi:hypothetical protein CO726_14330 [Bacillus fungorum]|uniref:Uncharacterized protein n=1 Tax=Bacillus fungorum TaxID=2039284 RepID=A0A2G6QE88_9BACI|nr:hypothetical protein [Bacillus fungorum]PIE94739.1 hypothetical protein CO726_14330 [Bacillus fungorum]